MTFVRTGSVARNAVVVEMNSSTDSMSSTFIRRFCHRPRPRYVVGGGPTSCRSVSAYPQSRVATTFKCASRPACECPIHREDSSLNCETYLKEVILTYLLSWR